MSDATNSATDRSGRLQAVIGGYLDAIQSGRPVDREAWLADHPDLADELRAFLADYHRFQELAAPLRHVAGAAAEAAPTVSHGAGVSTGSGSSLDRTSETGDPAAPPAAGTRVSYFGDYELLRTLGEGGMGIVFEARQRSLDRIVALKMIRAGRFAGEDERRRFRNEAAAVAQLDHPHIVPVYEVGEHEGDSYFSMKPIDGTSLAGRLGEFLDRPREAARLVATVAHALHHAHQRGVLHRDLKPSNILLDARGEPHLTDFGLAKRLEGPGAAELTRTGAILGTPAYMAPEQAGDRRSEVTTATDVHGLGALLYALLTGHAPFRGESVADTLVQVREGSPEPIRRANARVPRDLETICMRCLEREPRRRYASADAVAADLGRWLRGEPIAARPAGKLERGWMWCRRNPMVAGLTASVATALILGTAVSTIFAVRASNQARDERVEGIRADGAEKKMRKAIEEIEGSFARSLLRWLDDRGDGKHVLGPLEVENLWKLAGNGSGSLGLRFLDEATRGPKTVRELCARSEPALIAAVGLDQQKREQAIALLMNRLAQPGLPLAQKVDLAFTALELADRTGPDMGTCEGVLVEAMKANLPGQGRFVGMYHLTSSAERLEPATAGRLVLRALEMNPTPAERDGLIAALTEVASRLEPDTAGRSILQALSMKSHSSQGQRLAVALATVSSRLAPPESDRVCREAFRLLTDALVREGRPSLEEGLFNGEDVPNAGGFTALAARLPRGEAARSLTEALGGVTDPAARRRLASGLGAVIAELPPDEVSGVPPVVAITLAEALERQTDGGELENLTSGLAKLAKSWRTPKPADVRPVVQTLAAALKAEKDPWRRGRLALALAPMAEHLGPEESAPICLAAAESLSSGWTPATKLDPSDEWFSPFLAVIVQLPRNVAARNARLLATVTDSEVHRAHKLDYSFDALDSDDAARAARAFVATLRQEKDPSLREWLGAWLCILAGKMDPEDAARVCGPVLEGMNKAVATYWSSGSEHLINGFTVVASRQTATVASRSARVLADTFKEGPYSSDRSGIARGLVTLAGRMEPVEAERICGEAARVVAADIQQFSDNLDLLAQNAAALAALAGRMERLEAQRICSEAAPIFSRAWSRGKDANAVGISTLPQVLALMAGRMEPAEGARMLIELLERGTDGSNSMTLARQLLTVTARMEPGTAVPWVERAVEALLRARSAKHRDAMDRNRLDSSVDRPPGHPSDLEANAMDRRSFAASVAELLPRLEARKANARAAILAALMCSEGDASHRGDIWLEPGDWNWGSGPVVLSRILTDTSPMQRAARSLRMAVPTMGLGIGVRPAAAALAAEPWPCRLTTQELVDLLKIPTCFGRARRVVLDHLGNLHGRRFDNHWEFVRFAQEKHLSVDLTTPPRRPDLAALGTDEPPPR